MIRQFYDGYGEHFKLSDGSEYRYSPKCDKPQKTGEILCEKEQCAKKPTPFGNILSGVGADDLVLLGVVLFLLYDGVDDYILIIILGIIFVMGIGDNVC